MADTPHTYRNTDDTDNYVTASDSDNEDCSEITVVAELETLDSNDDILNKVAEYESKGSEAVRNLIIPLLPLLLTFCPDRCRTKPGRSAQPHPQNKRGGK